ncbi:MAG TPA: hypothetical protein DCY35_04180 [Prolixibacteraceae bacterium]|nr:hypothetical protein [Prolixibacteraceae bacterium]
MKALLFLAIMFFPVSLFAWPGLTYVGARSVSLGNSVVANPSMESVFLNQAGLAGMENFSVLVSYESRYALREFSLMAIGAILPFSDGTSGISFCRFGRELYKFSKTGLSYARGFGEHISAALQVDLLAESFPENKRPFVTITVETGMIKHISPMVTAGVHLFNPFPHRKNESPGRTFPSIFRSGLEWKLSDQLNWCVEVEKSSDQHAFLKTGLEFMAVSDFKLRIGVQGQTLQPSAGFGFVKEELAVDMAFSYHGNLGFSPSLTVSYCL